MAEGYEPPCQAQQLRADRYDFTGLTVVVLAYCIPIKSALFVIVGRKVDESLVASLRISQRQPSILAVMQPVVLFAV